tara:strand:+ start:778 stop:1449 length:672 start_codon:yes stop_codon:yes gene_type:complete
MSKTTIPAGGITDSAVTTAKINADAVTAAKIADDAVSEEHLDATAITGSTELAATPADTDEILISDAGVLKRLDFSHIKSSAGTQIVYADRSGDQSGIQHNTWTKLEYNTEQYDPNSLFNTAQDKYIVPSDGRYFFHASANFFGQIKRLYARFYVNGSDVNDTFYNLNGSFSSGTTYEFSMMIFGLLNLSQDDYVEAYVNLDIHSGTATANQVGTQFLAFRLD